MKRIVVSFLLVLASIAVTSCSFVTVQPIGEIEEKPTSEILDDDIAYSISVTITDNKDISVSDAVYLPEGSGCGEYFRQLCNKNDIVVKGVDDGYITEVDGLASEGDFAWMFFINGELSEVGINDYSPKKDDVISLEYINWKELFE